MRKTIVCLLTLALCLSLSGCCLPVCELFTPVYESHCTVYVNRTSLSSSIDISSSDLTASASLIDTYKAIIFSESCLSRVMEASGVSCSTDALREMATVRHVGVTEVFQIAVRASTPELAYDLTAGFCEVIPSHIANIVEGASVKIIDTATTPKQVPFSLFS